MSRQNVESARRWLDALSREDFDEALALVHPGIVFIPPGGQAPYRGAEALRRWMEPDAFRDQVIEPTEILEAGETTVFGRQHVTFRGAGSGIELELNSWSVWTFDDDGLITRLELYLEHEEERAREAAGLRD